MFLLAIHSAALAVVFAVPLDWYWRAVLAAAVLVGSLYAFLVHVLYLAPRAVREATWGSDGTWSLKLVSGERIEAYLLPSTYVTAWLLVLNFRCGRWRRPVLVILPDALDSDLLRRLRVRLLLSGAKRPADADGFTRFG